MRRINWKGPALALGLGGCSVAWAQENQKGSADPERAVAEAEDDARSERIESVDEAPEQPMTVAELLDAKERELSRREAELEQAHLDLEEARKAVDAKLAKLERQIAAIDENKSSRAKALEDEKLARLLQLIRTAEKMKPEAAAVYLDKFQAQTAAEILHGMKLRKAAEVISNMSASKAATLSRWFLRNGHPAPPYDPKQDDKL